MDNEITIKAYSECCDQSEEFQFHDNDDGVSLALAVFQAGNWVCGCKQHKLFEKFNCPECGARVFIEVGYRAGSCCDKYKQTIK